MIGKKVYLDFDGVMVWGEVWFNGNKLVEMDYGYLGCEVYLTDRLVYDKKNVIDVYSSTKGNSRWYTGGGIFRDVHPITKQVEIEGFSGKYHDLEFLAVIRTTDRRIFAKEKCMAPKGIRI